MIATIATGTNGPLTPLWLQATPLQPLLQFGVHTTAGKQAIHLSASGNIRVA